MAGVVVVALVDVAAGFSISGESRVACAIERRLNVGTSGVSVAVVGFVYTFVYINTFAIFFNISSFARAVEGAFRVFALFIVTTGRSVVAFVIVGT